ncbi:hypothetical protein ATK17_2275 [Branchiibius hedensis]|uniref:Glycosyl transferase family 2 n=1 Tax=Branchiibius hedensis TaxID=672460 RepID=A0A2Y9C1U4_9MICO|nr:hypothetical protein [Branchiibius hedensis]PWJ26131.1 hypothetical protein ATK17_2275 [Branchiibius hedensis]SSA34943.1 hypothetical protein SAMN04489750_2275 [Branchiibius hedensis]
MSPRIGAYVLTGDTSWLAKSLRSYYPLLSALVIPWPQDGRGWRGQELPLAEVRSQVEAVDDRRLLRLVPGRWTDRDHPLDVETAQRQAAVDALSEEVDWILQLDNDEYLPDPDRLLEALAYAEERDLRAVEWPARVLYRRTRSAVFQVATVTGQPSYEYPGPIAVRPNTRLVSARRVDEPFLRPVVEGDDASLQVARPAVSGEDRSFLVTPQAAIVHNSWARSPEQVWSKLTGWGHASGLRGVVYFAAVWWPAPVTWRLLRNFHPFARALWPRLARLPSTPEID